MVYNHRSLKMTKRQILLTNDDGIQSPGLWAAAEALSELGYVHVVAPRDQYSGAGRSLPSFSDGIISPRQVEVHGKEWTVYSVGGTPAQAVQHAILEIMPAKPDLVVSGINYGENVGVGITASGTVGAAIEAAMQGFPALAVSLETDIEHHLSYSTDVDFTASACLMRKFAQILMERKLMKDVDLLKVDVPREANCETPWRVTRLSRLGYFIPIAAERESWSVPGRIGYQVTGNPKEDEPDTDVYVMRVLRQVAITPLSLDMTSRVNLGVLEQTLRADRV
jgi:5'-nucleotidase